MSIQTDGEAYFPAMILIIREPATPEQISQMAEAYFGLMIKLAVDVKREILAGGGELHADCFPSFTRRW